MKMVLVSCLGSWARLLGHYIPVPYFGRLYVFSQKNKIKQNNLKKTPLDKVSNGSDLEMFQGTQESQFYFSRDNGCEFSINNV